MHSPVAYTCNSWPAAASSLLLSLACPQRGRDAQGASWDTPLAASGHLCRHRGQLMLAVTCRKKTELPSYPEPAWYVTGMFGSDQRGHFIITSALSKWGPDSLCYTAPCVTQQWFIGPVWISCRDSLAQKRSHNLYSGSLLCPINAHISRQRHWHSSGEFFNTFRWKQS